jgi:hypothetical protein
MLWCSFFFPYTPEWYGSTVKHEEVETIIIVIICWFRLRDIILGKLLASWYRRLVTYTPCLFHYTWWNIFWAASDPYKFYMMGYTITHYWLIAKETWRTLDIVTKTTRLSHDYWNSFNPKGSGLTYQKKGLWLFDKVSFNYGNYRIIYDIYKMEELCDNWTLSASVWWGWDLYIRWYVSIS